MVIFHVRCWKRPLDLARRSIQAFATYQVHNVSMPKYKLTYLDLRDRAEPSRLLFAAAGVDYEDVRIDFEKWPEWKAKTPLGNVPVLEVDGVEYPQSIAQQRYLACTFGFMGNNALENFQCDVVVDTCDDLRVPYLRDVILYHIRWKDAEKEESAKEKLLEEGLSKFLPVFDKFLTDYGRGSGYFVGSKLTWADLAMYEILELPIELFPDMMKKYPRLLQHRELVESNPKIKAYLEKRPTTFA